MAKIKLQELKAFCKTALTIEGMSVKNATTVAEVLSDTDAWGTHSHGTKNLHNYIKKLRSGGADIKADPVVIKEGPAYALVDAKNTLGMISSVMAMELACKKAETAGIAIVTVKNSSHFGAAGYYSNLAAKRGLIGLAMSNADQNMTVPGARDKVMGNDPFSYAAPSKTVPSVFLDIAMSNVASLKVLQARKEGREVPSTWIVDKDGLPTTDPSHYAEEGALQPMAAHKGYGLAIMVEILSGMLSGADTSPSGKIKSWIFDLDAPNNVSHAFISINPRMFVDGGIAESVDDMVRQLHSKPKAKGSDHIYTPGEIEWSKYEKAVKEGVVLTPDVEESLKGLSDDTGIELKLE